MDYCYVDKQQLKDASCYDVDDYCVKGDEAGHGVLYVWKLRLTNVENYFQILKMFAIGNFSCLVGSKMNQGE